MYHIDFRGFSYHLFVICTLYVVCLFRFKICLLRANLCDSLENYEHISSEPKLLDGSIEQGLCNSVKFLNI